MTDQKPIILDDSELDISHYDFLRKELQEDNEQSKMKSENKDK